MKWNPSNTWVITHRHRKRVYNAVAHVTLSAMDDTSYCGWRPPDGPNIDGYDPTRGDRICKDCLRRMPADLRAAIIAATTKELPHAD